MARLYEDDTHERYFHIYYNPSKQAAERELLEQMIEKIKSSWTSGSEILQPYPMPGRTTSRYDMINKDISSPIRSARRPYSGN